MRNLQMQEHKFGIFFDCPEIEIVASSGFLQELIIHDCVEYFHLLLLYAL